MMSERSRFPFTATQWQELEHQALIFKYMISGMPIPPDLLFSIKRSMDLTLSSRLFPHQSQQYGWNCLQMGLGRKVDPEPGRCRRTDGKKWRCSKEAYPDSKYCERHMHRGKNRSRKPVEVMTTPATATATTTTTNYKNPSSINKIPSSSMFTTSNLTSLSSTASETQHHQQYHHDHPCYNTHTNPFYYPHLSSSRPPEIGLSSQDNHNITHLVLDSASYSQTQPDYRDRYVHGMKEEVDEHLFFSEASGTMRSFSGSSMDDSCQLTPLTMSSTTSLSQSKQRNSSEIQSDYSTYLRLQSLTDTPKHHNKQDHHQQHSYGLGNEMAFKMARDNEPQKTIHRFFDEWPNLDDHSSNCSSLSTTQLSISVPTSSHVFPIFNSRTHHDG